MDRRLLIQLPPLIALLSGLALLIASLAAWGAANNAGLPSWLTTFGGFMFSLPALLASFVCLRIVRDLTRQSFFISTLQIAVGTILFAILTAWETALTLNVGDAETYEGIALEGGASLSTPELLIVIFLVTSLKGFLAAAAVYVYAGGVTAEFTRDDRSGEEDAMGALLQEHRDGHTPAPAETRSIFARPPNDGR
jgi:hypothetical protein